eukprot:1188887-Rhodomonas_salina.1
MHRMLLAEIHSEASHADAPILPLLVKSTTPMPRPVTVKVWVFDPRFVAGMLVNAAASNVTTSVTELTSCADVMTKVTLPPAQPPTLQIKVLSEAQSVASQTEPPTRVDPV